MNLTFIRIAIIGILAIALFFGLVGFRDNQVKSVTAEEKSESVHIVPSVINSEDWENIESARVQDLSEDSIFNDFNTANSAFVISEEYRNQYYRTASPSLSEISLPTPEGVGTPTDSVGAESTPEPVLSPEIDPEPKSESEITPEISLPTPEGVGTPTDSVVAESTPEPEPTLTETPTEVPQAETENIPETNSEPEEEASEPSAFFRFFERTIFSKAWAQEMGVVSDSYGSFSSCDDENSECLVKRIEFSGFGIADTLIEKPIKNIQLRFSLAGAKGNMEDVQAPGRVLVEYFFKNKWIRGGEILMTDEVSNSLNGGYFLYALPEFKSWEELDSFRVRLSVQYFGDSEMNVFLDGLWLEAEAEYEELPPPSPSPLVVEDSVSEFGLELVSASNSFSSGEIPEFSLNYKKEGGVLDMFSLFFMSLIGGGGIELSAMDQKTDVGPKIDSDGKNFKIEFQNSRFFTPGKHRLKMIVSDNGNEYKQEQEFLWGTLFINMEKTFYRTDETAKVYIEVLDDLGNPVCDARIRAEIKSSLGRISTFSTENGNIYYSGKCLSGGDKNSTGFYLNYQIPPEAGITKIELRAETNNGPRAISDTFEVVGSYPLEVSRSAPNIIVPGVEYRVSFRIRSDTDFNGVFKEIVPANFEITPSLDQDSPMLSIEEDGYSRILSWPLSLKAGEYYTLDYSFRALNSPATLYVIGPASLGGFNELRSWQMVSSDGNRSLMLNSNSVHSCKINPFSQEVSAGKSARYNIDLISSETEKPFLLSFPGLPSDVIVSLNRATGSGDGIYADIFVQPDAQRGSFNIVMAYQEREDNGAILGTSCQLNLVVE